MASSVSRSGSKTNPRPSDLAAEVFLTVRRAFFDAKGLPRPYELRQKRNTQDDPFDEYVHRVLSEKLPEDAECVKAPGPLITPDLVVLRPAICNQASRAVLATDLTSIVGMEVKKLERTKAGMVARASGMDYNTTPPCGTVRVYDAAGAALDIRGFYIFVCQEPFANQEGHYRLSALGLCDGNLLNADFEYYLSIVGERTKEIGLGTFGDGANRSRPMLIFANPLGVSELDHEATLIHSRHNLEKEFPQLLHFGTVNRTDRANRIHAFHCYRLRSEAKAVQRPFELLDPLPLPKRTEKTQPRGRFRLQVRPAD